MPDVGSVWRHAEYYLDEDGKPLPKYLLVLAEERGDVTFRLLTSQSYGRPKGCNHAQYPSFYLGVLGGVLSKESWLDLRETFDMDGQEFAVLVKRGLLTQVLAIGGVMLCDALLCTHGADDTSVAQARRVLDARAKLGCR